MSASGTTPVCGIIPHPTAWYAKEPFDHSCTFRDADGHVLRYMATPLDETYSVEPGNNYAVGSIPPEEQEPLDHLPLAIMLHNRESWPAFWLGLLGYGTRAFKSAHKQFETLDDLCTKSREHRAAFCRIAHNSRVDPRLRDKILRIVERSDRIRRGA